MTALQEWLCTRSVDPRGFKAFLRNAIRGSTRVEPENEHGRAGLPTLMARGLERC